MEEHQVHLQALAFGSQEPSVSIGACKRTCRHDSSLLCDQKKTQEKQLDKGISAERVLELQLCKELREE